MLQACASQALSSEAAALLGDQPPEVQAALQAYGRHLGIAYQVRVVSLAIVKCSSKCFYMPLEYYGYFYYVQLVDDYLDFVGSSASLGKPALSDMDQGLATAPVLFALEEFPQIGDIVKRRFGDEGDAALVGDLVSQSDGLRRTQELATAHARKAAEALGVLAPSTARDALLRLCFDVLNRQA